MCVTVAIEDNAQKVMMPALSPTMVEGTIVKWLKKEGKMGFICRLVITHFLEYLITGVQK